MRFKFKKTDLKTGIVDNDEIYSDKWSEVESLYKSLGCKVELLGQTNEKNVEVGTCAKSVDPMIEIANKQEEIYLEKLKAEGFPHPALENLSNERRITFDTPAKTKEEFTYFEDGDSKYRVNKRTQVVEKKVWNQLSAMDCKDYMVVLDKTEGMVPVSKAKIKLFKLDWAVLNN
jgi:hypothetical protein